MVAYYNEVDAHAAAWLRALIARGLIARGEVDQRDIRDVRPDDLRGFDQVHLFAGIGGWSCALRLAGWPDDAPVWTGSCPCQPFSNNGKRKGAADERHLWPEMRRLIVECRPSVILGEQVASVLGRHWFSAVRADLEALGYACGAADLCAASVGAPHIRQRLYWVAYAAGARLEERANAYTDNTISVSERDRAPRYSRSQWDECGWVRCRDGRRRPIEPSTFPLANGVPARVVRLRGYGNAIVPQLAARFVRAAQEAFALTFFVRNDDAAVSTMGSSGS